MKNLFLLTVLICSSIYWHNAGAQSVDWNAVEQHYFDVYQPTDTPQWIFPIIAINGDGQSDTMRYCYDLSASLYNYDEINFGELIEKVDTGKFSCGFFAPSIDSMYSVQCFGGPEAGAPVGYMWMNIINGTYLLTLKWNGSKLYDTVLPFPNILPKPIARIEGTLVHNYTPYISGFGESYIIADTAGFNCLPPTFFSAIDSVIFDGPINASPDNSLSIGLSMQKHDASCTIGNTNNIIDHSITIFPNPVVDFVLIELLKSPVKEISISNIYGQHLISTCNINSFVASLNVSQLPAAIYLLKITTNEKIYIKSFLKQ